MLSKSLAIIFLAFVTCVWSQTYTQLGYSDCGSKNVEITRLWFRPMPILQPGNGTLSLAIRSTERIQGVIKATVKITRKVAGIPLPIQCYLVDGQPVGSCNYTDLCTLLKSVIQYEPGQCPQNLAAHGIDCECPVNIITNTLDIELDLSVPKAPEAVNWISVGDFDVRLNATVGNIVGCYDLKFAVKPNFEEKSEFWSWTDAKYLSTSNWTSSLKANTNLTKVNYPVWFIFQYLSYCGACKRAKGSWEASAQYASSWSRYVKIGAYDCGDDSQSTNTLCKDSGYPQWKIFCPLTNSTQLAFDSERRTVATTPEDILMWIIKRMNKIASDCYGKSWPIRDALKPTNLDDLNNIIPKRTKQFVLFVSDDILLYSLYVLNNSKTVGHEPVYRLATQNPITNGAGIWKGMRNDDGRITIEPMNSTKAFDQFVLRIDPISLTNESEKAVIGSIRPTVADIDSAIISMLNKDIRRKLPSLFEDVKIWLKFVHTYYTGSDTMRDFLGDLIDYMNNRTTLSPNELKNYIDSTSKTRLPDVKFDHCLGSDPSKRGYTCSLWILFHSMTIKQAVLAEQKALSSDVKPTDMILSIREFIRKFFICEECVKNFLNGTSNAENMITSFKGNVLYFWRGHNKVNQRLRSETTSSDPAWPKVPFPTKQQCNLCVRQVDQNGDAIEYDEDEVYNFLKDYYSQQSLSQKSLSSKTKNAATKKNHSQILFYLFMFCFHFLK